MKRRFRVSPSGGRSARWRRRWPWVALCLGLVATGLGVGLAWLAIGFVPLPPALFAPAPPPLVLQDRSGQPLRWLRDEQGFVGQEAPLADVPQYLIDATLAAEDKRFWEHPGADWRATLRAGFDYVRRRRVISGASTITQQLLKLADPRPRTIPTKLLEAARALRLERVWPKERILAAYLNRIDYGNFNRGCAAAAEFYFDKPLRLLSVAEAALLAGLPQGPSRLNPHTHREAALARQRWVLDRMRANGWLTEAERRQAGEEILQFAPPGRAFRAPHFVDFLVQSEQVKPTLPGSGEVRTTLDLEVQEAAEGSLRRQLALIADHGAHDGALVVLDNRSGDVLAMIGSPDYFSPRAGQVNGAWAARSAGSTLKPFTYLLALEQGATPASLVADVPTTFPTRTGVFTPVNYDRRFHGPTRYRMALANSLNVPAVRVLDGIGGAPVLQECLRACGLTTLTAPPEHYGLGLTLGNAEVRLLELVNAYACLARLGEHRPWRLAALGPSTAGTRVFTEGAAWLVADILDDEAARQLAFGTDSPLRFAFPVACKTGTSSDFRDNWAVGFTPEFTVGVWVGNFDGAPLRGVSGVTGAAPVLHEVMEWLHERRGTTGFARPAIVVGARIHPVTGRRLPAGAGNEDDSLKPAEAAESSGIDEWFVRGNLPASASATDYDAQGRLQLPPEYAAWLESGDNWLGSTAVATRETPGLRIAWPPPGTVFFLDPDLPEAGSRVRLRTEGASAVRWESDTLVIDEGPDGGAWLHLREGRHRLLVVGEGRGARAETWIEVRRL